MSWLDAPPLIEMEQGPATKPYPLSWEVQVPELSMSLFILPITEHFQTSNSQERIVALNAIARRVTDEQRA